jgi:hypothetical protein
MQRAMPDVSNIAWEQRPCVAPVGAVIVLDLAGALGMTDPSPVPPGRIVLDPVRRIGDHQLRRNTAQRCSDSRCRSAVAAHQPMSSKPPDIA